MAFPWGGKFKVLSLLFLSVFAGCDSTEQACTLIAAVPGVHFQAGDGIIVTKACVDNQCTEKIEDTKINVNPVPNRVQTHTFSVVGKQNGEVFTHVGQVATELSYPNGEECPPGDPSAYIVVTKEQAVVR